MMSEWGSHLTPDQFMSSRMTAIRWTHPDKTSFIYRHQFRDFDGPYAVVIPALGAVVAFDLFMSALEYAQKFDREEIAEQLKGQELGTL